jgi:predicted Zn-dependent protease
VFLFFLGGCQSSSKLQTKDRELTPEEELSIAREILPGIQRDHPALQNEVLQLRVTNVGQKIVNASSLEGNPYHFSFVVVDVPSINAFSLPAGYIFITEPLLQFVASDDELAGIISHEIAHILLQHTSKNFIEMETNQQRSWRYGMGGALLGAGIGAGVSSAVCAGNSSCGAVLTGSSLGVGLQAGLLTEKYIFLKQSQQKELDADKLGFSFTEKAGFRPQAMQDFFNRIEKMKSSKLVDRLSSHPTTTERLQQLNR